VLWKKAEIVFSSQINVQPCHVILQVSASLCDICPCATSTFKQHSCNLSTATSLKRETKYGEISQKKKTEAFLALILHSLSFSPKSLTSLLTPFNLPPKLSFNI
jgi:hypothetical protein